jgi:type IX secretion system PorP/SprF family membrane protein
MKFKLSIFFLLPFAWPLFAQQNPHFSTYMFNHFSINPAYCGSKQTLYVNSVNRFQWVGMGKEAPQSNSVNVQYPNKRRRVGLGLNLLNDRIGANNNTTALFTYAYHLKLPVGRLSMGLRAGFQSLMVDFNRVVYEDKSDIYVGQVIRKTAPNGDFGLYYYTADFYASLALNQLWGARLRTFKDLPDFTRVYPHLFLTAGKAFIISSDLIINPSVLIKKVQGAPYSIDFNCNARFGDRFWAGLSYRNKNALVILAQMGITERLRFGYSYDVGLNGIGTVSGATHEFYLGFDFNVHNNKIISTRYL